MLVAPSLEPNCTTPPIWLSVVLLGCVPALKDAGSDDPMNMVTVPLAGVTFAVCTVTFEPISIIPVVVSVFWNVIVPSLAVTFAVMYSLPDESIRLMLPAPVVIPRRVVGAAEFSFALPPIDIRLYVVSE